MSHQRQSAGYLWTLSLILILFLFWLVITADAQRELQPLRDVREPFVQSIIVDVMDTWDSRDIKFISLKSAKGSILLSGDKDLEIVQFLLKHDGKKVVLSIE